MMLLLGFAALLLAAFANYCAARARRGWIGRAVLLAVSLPALLFAGYHGARFGYAAANADEVNARFAEGDLSYFGADMAFGVSLVLAAFWLLAVFGGFRLGRRSARRKPTRA